MKTNHFRKISGGVLTLLFCAVLAGHAQQRFGGGGGFGGGGFGGGGFGGGFNAARGGSGSTTAYNNNGAVGSATISVDPQTHNLVISADEITAMQISNVLASLDAPKSQVLIKVIFLEVQRNDGSDIGVEGGFTKGVGNNLQSSAANVFGLAGNNSVITNFTALGGTFANASTVLTPGTAGPQGIYQIAGNDFQATLRAIATAGRSQVLSRPSILARDGQLAKIVVGQSVPLPTSVSYSTSGNNTIPIVNVTYTDVGIILNVTPFIGDNHLVEMIIQPQISAVNQTQSQVIAPGVSAPYLDIRSADTVVVTPDGQPVVIGGLISNDKSQSDTKIPYLGDIPLIGNLFKTSAKTSAKTELLMFLTPHIVETPTMLGAMSTREQRQTPIINDSVSEQELDHFLERTPAKKK
jgi:general secretion pathway protein D